jgi:hypothetical protein
MSFPSAVTRSERTLPHAVPRRTRAWRWLAVLAIVLCLHWIAAQWIERNRTTFTPENTAHVPVQIALLTPERIERQPAASAPRPAAPAESKPTAAASKPRERVLTATSTQHAAAVAAASAVAAEAASAAEANAAAQAAASAAAANAAAAASAAASAHAAATKADSGVKFSVPPSGDLQYDTFYNGVRNQPGTIHWSSDGKTYDMVVSLPVPFIGSFTYSSHGHIDAFGLAPDQYVEKRGHRPEDVSVFNRTTKQIVFTRTPASLPLSDGAQDRFSMVMQLASLVRGNPDAYKPGVTRQFFVVDNDSGEIWPVETIGDETIRTQDGYLSVRHFMRLPRHAGDQRRIDVWLAPSLGWLPARLVQTEPNGTEVELLWRGPLSLTGGSGNASSQGSQGGGAVASGDSSRASPAVNPATSPAANSAASSAVSSAANPSVNPAASAAEGPAPSPAENPAPNPAANPATNPSSAAPTEPSAPPAAALSTPAPDTTSPASADKP